MEFNNSPRSTELETVDMDLDQLNERMTLFKENGVDVQN